MFFIIICFLLIGDLEVDCLLNEIDDVVKLFLYLMEKDKIVIVL